jgi:hypothetical protein
MSKQLLEKEETQVPSASLPDQEEAHRMALSARLQSRQRMRRQRNITGREIGVLTLASVIMAALLILGVIFSQPNAQTRTSASTTSATRSLVSAKAPLGSSK